MFHFELTLFNIIILVLASISAGFINALAGGGTLITFPVLIALGIPPVAANVTNTIALCPGYLAGTYAQKQDFIVMKKILWLIIPVAVFGGIVGGVLLIYTPEKSFRSLIPYLIFAASAILALQKLLKKILAKRNEKTNSAKTSHLPLLVLVFFSAIYGGYFGAGLGVILMAVLGLLLHESLTRINALKQSTSFCINFIAALYFCFSGLVIWTVVAVMLAGSLTGGMLGGKMAGKINPEILRWIVIVTGFSIALYYFVK